MKKKVLILGGSSDIGYELTKIFIKYNYHVTAHYFSNLKKLRSIKSKNLKIFKFNFLKFKNIDCKNINKKFGENFDIIINLVGFFNNKSFQDFDLNSLQNSIQINSIVPFLIIRSSINHMLKNKWGRILNSSSIGVKYGGGENTFTYSLSKQMNEYIPIHLRKLANKNILYNVLRIGLTNTKLHSKILKKNLLNRVKLIPMKRMAKPKEIAEYIFFLSSERNTFITGEVLSISGGE